MEAVLAGTAGVAKLFMREDELGKVLPDYFADCILVDGDPLDDVSILQHHSLLHVVLISGRIHKISSTKSNRRDSIIDGQTDVNMTLTNYMAYALKDGTARTRIGHFDAESKTITPLAYSSGTPLSNLYEVIEIGPNNIIASGAPFASNTVQILPPLTSSDVLAIGKNYLEHAKEFNASGYDASDKLDMPSHPVVFTKRATSIIADGEEILPFPEFTSTLDYEGEIGVIISRTGHKISDAEALNYVWGYTIINDVTAREKQRDHKQFYIGKSGDTFCPMGPIAVPASRLPKVLKLQTRVNGELRQETTTDDLIFPITTLITTLSESQTIQAGDIIATGTPAGVGFGFKPPKFLQAGDVIEVSVTGLGTLRNKVAEVQATNHVYTRLSATSTIPVHNLRNSGKGLTLLNSKPLYVEILGPPETSPVVFVHGLGGSTTFFKPLIHTLKLDSTHSCVLYNLEGHGLSPTKASSILSIRSYTNDLVALFQDSAFKLENGAIIIAHSMGCLIALSLATQYPKLVKKLILLGPPANPLPKAAASGSLDHAHKVRDGGMQAVAEAVGTAGTSSNTKTKNPLAYAAVLQSLLSQDIEGFAKGCTALAESGNKSSEIDLRKVHCKTLVVTGDEDNFSSLSWCEQLVAQVEEAKLEVLLGVGHWAGYEDVDGLARVVADFI